MKYDDFYNEVTALDNVAVLEVCLDSGDLCARTKTGVIYYSGLPGYHKYEWHYDIINCERHILHVRVLNSNTVHCLTFDKGVVTIDLHVDWDTHEWSTACPDMNVICLLKEFRVLGYSHPVKTAAAILECLDKETRGQVSLSIYSDVAMCALVAQLLAHA